MDYVTHTCKKCKCAFVAEDYTNAQDIPPTWRYCPECAKKLGIDYDKQTPWSNRSEKRNEQIKAQIERLKQYRFKKKENVQN